MITINGKKLISHFACLSNDFGETPLILAVKGSHTDMVKLLVDELDAPVGQTGRFSWKGIDYQAVPPLFVAILAKQADSLPILKFLIGKDLPADNNSSPAVLDSTMSSSAPLTQKIDILELVGAAYILRCCPFYAMKCWMQAMALRQMTEGGEPSPPDEHFQRMMGNASELTSMEQLEEMAFHPVPLITQALFVSRRILNRIDPGLNVFLLCLCIERSFEFFVLEHYFQMLDVSIFVAQILNSVPLDNLVSFRFAVSYVFNSMSLVLREVFRNEDAEQDLPSIDNLIRATHLGSVLIYKRQKLRLEGRWTPNEIVRDKLPNNEMFFIFNGSVFDMIYTTTRMSLCLYRLAREEVNRPRVKQCLIQYNRFTRDNPGVVSLLHLAVNFADARKLPIDVIQLLLETGADPNAVDIYGNTPLHLLALNCEREDKNVVAQLLLDAGCHFDQSNANGETALMLSKKPRGAQAHPFVQIVPSLSCCCAQAIGQHDIPFQHLPPSVQSDIQIHVAKGPHSSWYLGYAIL